MNYKSAQPKCANLSFAQNVLKKVEIILAIFIEMYFLLFTLGSCFRTLWEKTKSIARSASIHDRVFDSNS